MGQGALNKNLHAKGLALKKKKGDARKELISKFFQVFSCEVINDEKENYVDYSIKHVQDLFMYKDCDNNIECQ